MIIDGAAGLQRALAAVWDGVPVQRRTVHKHRNLLACLRTAARGDQHRSHRHDLHLSSEEVLERRTGFLPNGVCATEPSGQPGGGRRGPVRLRAAAAKPLNAVERLHGEFRRRIKTQTVLPSAARAAMLFRAFFASGQIRICKIDGWPSLAKPLAHPVALAA